MQAVHTLQLLMDCTQPSPTPLPLPHPHTTPIPTNPPTLCVEENGFVKVVSNTEMDY